MSADNPAGLISIAAIQSQDRSYLFYSRPNGNLAYLKSQQNGEAGAITANPLYYKPNNILVDGNVISANVTSPQIAALAYNSNSNAQIRLYYISGEGELQELCQTNGGPWTQGSLNNSAIQASPKSLLSASVEGGRLKLYYNREHNPNMFCTWVKVDEEAWATRKINDKY